MVKVKNVERFQSSSHQFFLRELYYFATNYLGLRQIRLLRGSDKVFSIEKYSIQIRKFKTSE